MSDLEMVLDITNEKGLHARASAKFVETVEKFDANAVVSREGMVVSGDSIMGLLMLGASIGTQIEVKTTGAQASELADAITTLLAEKFGEGK